VEHLSLPSNLAMRVAKGKSAGGDLCGFVEKWLCRVDAPMESTADAVLVKFCAEQTEGLAIAGDNLRAKDFWAW